VRPVLPFTVRAAAWLVRRTVPDDAAGALLGDLFEEFDEHRRPWRFVRDAVSILLHRGVRSLDATHAPVQRKASSMESLVLDLRYALRSLRKRPGFAAVVVATLALGIGASTAIFSVVEGILIRPLPFSDPDRLVAVNELDGGDRMSFAWPNFLDVRARAQSFDALACHQGNAFNVIGIGPARRVNGRLVCAAFFDVLGVSMQAGRRFTEADDAAGATPVAIVSDRFWRNDLGADPSAIGRTLRTTEMTFTIVGVLPASFRFSRPEDLYVPIQLTVTPGSGWLDRGNHFGLNGLARLKGGVTVAQADAEMKLIAEDLKRTYPNTNARSSAEVVPLKNRMVDQVRGTLQALMGAVGFLLLLACVNVANLFVARGAARQHELAIRTALGGSRARVVRQLLVETSVLAFGGAVVGVVMAYWLLALLIGMAPEGIPRIEDIGLNRTSLLFALGAALVCGLVFGAFPALQASSATGTRTLTRTSGTLMAAPRRTRRALMVVEVALALILLTGCGLMARTMLRLTAVDPGFDPEGLLTARVVLSGQAGDSIERRIAFHEELVAAVKRLPGVTHAALTLSLPIEGSNWGSIFIVRDKPVPPRAELPASAFIPVSIGYFETMGIPIRAGRPFTEADTRESRRVAVVNETFARRMWPGEDPLGKFVKQGWPETPEKDSPWREVVGVVPDVKLEGVDQDVPLQAYLPLRQEPARSVAIVARTSVPPETLAQPLAAAVQSLNKDLPVTRVLSMGTLMRTAIARQMLSTVILAVFAGVAILLAGVGLYGVVSHSVTERTREIGVRLALGSGRGAVLRLFVLQGVATAALGTVAGFAGAYYLSRWLSTLLFEVQPTDPVTYAAVAILLLAVAAGACYFPARRASRVDPLIALRSD
jgi:putative ABC transport system permease protein